MLRGGTPSYHPHHEQHVNESHRNMGKGEKGGEEKEIETGFGLFEPDAPSCRRRKKDPRGRGRFLLLFCNAEAGKEKGRRGKEGPTALTRSSGPGGGKKKGCRDSARP